MKFTWCAAISDLGVMMLCCASIIAVNATALAADNWPSKPVRIVNPYTAGGGVDVVGRAIAQQLSELWGQPVVTDNRDRKSTRLNSSH